MTREEAQKTIEIIMGKMDMNNLGIEADELAEVVEALVPKPDEVTGLVPCGCEYCNGTNEQKPLFHENNYSPYTRMESCIMVSESMDGKRYLIDVDLWDGANACAAFEINYCPMCGRRLKEDEA